MAKKPTPETNQCPYCDAEYHYDTCQDYYKWCEEKEGRVAGREVNLHVCKCGAVMAVTVTDEDHGSSVYTADGRLLVI